MGISIEDRFSRLGTHSPVTIDPSRLLDAGIPGGLNLASFANDAFNQAIQLFDTIVSFNLPTVPVVRDFTEPLFTGGVFTTGAVPIAPPDPVIPGLAPVTAPQFSAASFFIPPPPVAPPDIAAPNVRDLVPPAFSGAAFVQPSFLGTIPAAASFPASPAVPSLATITVGAVDPAPVLTAILPSIVQPTPPADFTGVVPIIDTLQPIILPAQPDDTLPTAPTLEQIVLPASPVIITPSFDAVLVGSPADPTAVFTFNQTVFQDTLLDAVKTKLNFWLDNNQTGLSDAIYQAIWQRAREREDGISLQAREESFEEFAARGFSLPPGALVKRNQEIIQGNQNKSSSLSREQAIKQAEMEVDNVRYAMTEASRLEVALIDNHLQTERLGFDIARTTVDLALQLFAAQVNRYNADVSAFRTRAEVFKVLLEGEVLKLDVFRAELEGEKIKGEINTQKIDNYRAQIDAVLATFELFKSQLEASRFVIDSNRLLIDKFSAEIEGFATEARAAAIATDIYSSRINAEKLKIDSFSSEVDAFQAQTNAYSALVQAKATAKGQEIEVERFKIESFRAEIDAVRGQIDALVAQLQSDTSVFDSQVGRFSAESGAETGRFSSEVDKFRGDTDAYRAQIDRDVGAATIEVDTARVNNDKFDSKTKSYAAQVDAEGRRFAGEVDKFEADITGFTAVSQRDVDSARILVDSSNARAAIYDAQVRGFIGETQAESARYGAEADLFRARIQAFEAKGRQDVDAARVSVEHLVGQLNLLSERVLAGARIAGQLGSAALATFNFSNVVSNSASFSQSNSNSNSSSTAANTMIQDSFSTAHIETCSCD